MKLIFQHHIKLLLLCGLLIFASSCRAWFEVQDAATAYDSKEYFVAAKLYKLDYEKEKDDVEKAVLAERIGDCYRNANKTEEAETWYEKAIPFATNTEIVYKYGQMLKSNEKYDNAIQVFKEYSFSNPVERAKAKKQINSCILADKWQKEKSDFVVEAMPDLNSAYSDYAPVWLKESGLIFTSARETAKGEKLYGWTGEKHSDLFFAERQANNRFAPPISFSDTLNSVYNEGTLTFTPDFKSIYFTRCGSDDLIDNYCNLYYSTQNANGNWSKAERVPLFESDSINVGQPFLSPDGKILYFSADAPDSYGDKDIYMVKQSRDGWSYPKNLGPKINTNGYEGFPYIHTDGKLYFSSNGHSGMGGLDIFVAEPEGKKWGNVQNLQYPINSSADDFSLIFQPYILPEEMDKIKEKGYLSSTRKGGKGNDDIYQFVLTIPQEPEIVVDSSTIVSKDTIKKSIPKYVLEVEILENLYEDPDNPNSKNVGTFPLKNAIAEVLGLSFESTLSERLITNNKGKCSIELEENTEYKVTASNNAYLTQSKLIETKGNTAANTQTQIIRLQFILEKIYRQQEIVIDNIYYDLDKADIRKDAEPVLNQVAELLKENPNIVVEFGSHTDSRGSDRYNLNLSQERAESVVNYLISQKINPNRLVPKGYGESNLVNDCVDGVQCSEEEHQQNRRTTFKVLSDDFRGQN